MCRNFRFFTQNKCLVHYCRNNALSSFDETGNICETKGYCLDHIPDPGKAKDDIYNYIINHDIIVGLNACGLILSDIDFSNKKFFWNSRFTKKSFVRL